MNRVIRIDSGVNTYSRQLCYLSVMAGTKKKRALDPEFSERLNYAMSQADDQALRSAPGLAAEVGGTRQAIYRLLKAPKQVETWLLFDLSRALNIRAEWLYEGHGDMREQRHTERKSRSIMGRIFPAHMDGMPPVKRSPLSASVKKRGTK